jgi:hypothetical protein
MVTVACNELVDAIVVSQAKIVTSPIPRRVGIPDTCG